MLAALLPAVPAAAAVPTAAQAPVAVPIEAAYTAVTPVRLMDTRRSGGALGSGGTRNLTVAGGISGVPAGASAVVLNVTVTGTTAASFLTVYPAGTARPTASNLNWVRGKTIPNLVEVKVGSGGQVTFYNSAGSTHVIADLQGYFFTPSGTAGQHIGLTPGRITDTRTGSGSPNAGSHLGAGTTLNVQVTGVGNVPATGVSAAILNVTVTNTSAASFLIVWPMGTARPATSNLNWTRGVTIPNRVIVPVSAGGKVSVYNQFGSVDVIVDVSGYFTDATVPGALFTPLSPTRIADTRGARTLGAGGVLTLQVGGVGAVPSSATAVILNVTVTNTTAASFLTVYPSTALRPTASDLNWVRGVTIPNLTVATLGSTGALKFYNSAGRADVVVDLVGYFSVPNAPTIVSVVPSFGPSAGGTAVDVNGTNFQPGAVVTFNSCLGGSGGTDSAAQTVTFVSSTVLHIASTTANPHSATAQSTCNVNVTNPDTGTANLAGGWTYNGTPSDLVSATISVGTKQIVTTWSQAVDCPAASAAQFTFADNYTGPGKASGGTGAVAANVASGTASIECTITFGTEVANFGVNDYGTFTYTQPASPTTSNAVNNSNGFAPTTSVPAADVSAPTLTGLGAVVGSQVVQVVYSEPVLCSTLSVADYSAMLNGGNDAVIVAACDQGFGGSSRLVNVSLTSAPSATSDTLNLTSQLVADQYGNLESAQSGPASVFSAQMHLTGIAATTTGYDGGTGTITLTFSSSVDCASIDADASDFVVTNDSFNTETITLTSVNSCSANIVVYNYSVDTGGVFTGDYLTATAQDGTDGETVLNFTDNQWELAGDSLQSAV